MIDPGAPNPSHLTASAPPRGRVASVRGWVFGQADRRMLVIVGAVAAVVISVLAWNGRHGSDPVAAENQPGVLLAHPGLAYSVPVRHADVRTWVFGSAERLAVASSSADGSTGSVAVFDKAGAEMWRQTFEGGFTAIWDEDRMLVTVPVPAGGYRLASLDGQSGNADWSVDVPTPYIVVGDKDLYVVDADTVSMLARDTGATKASVPVTDAGSISELLGRSGAFFDVGEKTIQLMSDELDPIGEPIPRDGSTAFGFADGETLVAVGGELVSYNIDGAEIARRPDPVGRLDGLTGLGASMWLATGRGRVAVLRVGESLAEVVWQAPGTLAEIGDATDARDNGGVDGRVDGRVDGGYVVVREDGSGSQILSIETGELVTSSTNALQLWANGYSTRSGARLRAYGLPGKDELFDSGEQTGRSAFVIDGGYAVIDDTPNGVTMSVFGTA